MYQFNNREGFLEQVSKLGLECCTPEDVLRWALERNQPEETDNAVRESGYGEPAPEINHFYAPLSGDETGSDKDVYLEANTRDSFDKTKHWVEISTNRHEAGSRGGRLRDIRVMLRVPEGFGEPQNEEVKQEPETVETAEEAK
jgi:hypothetical protein